MVVQLRDSRIYNSPVKLECNRCFRSPTPSLRLANTHVSEATKLTVHSHRYYENSLRESIPHQRQGTQSQNSTARVKLGNGRQNLGDEDPRIRLRPARDLSGVGTNNYSVLGGLGVAFVSLPPTFLIPVTTRPRHGGNFKLHAAGQQETKLDQLSRSSVGNCRIRETLLVSHFPAKWVIASCGHGLSHLLPGQIDILYCPLR